MHFKGEAALLSSEELKNRIITGVFWNEKG
jgi:hypothetical protein